MWKVQTKREVLGVYSTQALAKAALALLRNWWPDARLVQVPWTEVRGQ